MSSTIDPPIDYDIAYIRAVGNETSLSMAHDELIANCPLYRLYLKSRTTIGSGVLPWWFVHRSCDWAWEASAVHDFWYSHEWLADIVDPVDTRDKVDQRWYDTASMLAGFNKKKRRELKIGMFMIRNLAGAFWKI